MPQYRVRPGFTHGVRNLGPGSVVTMTEREAVGFLDKLERVEETVPVPADKRAGESDSAVASAPTLQFWQETPVLTTTAPSNTTWVTPAAFDGTVVSPSTLVTQTTTPANAVDFAAIKGISERMQDVLYAEGWYTWESVLQAGVIGLRDAGIDMIHARMLFNIAQREAD